MKRLISLFLLHSSIAIMSMEQPDELMPLAQAGQTPAQIAQEARKRIILEGPDAQLYKTNSFLWAYMHPQTMEFNEHGIKFPHYKHPFVTYVKKWEEAHATLNSLKSELKEVEDSEMAGMIKIIAPGPQHRPSLSQVLAIQKILLKKFEADIHDCHSVTFKTNREKYRTAFSAGRWLELSVLALHPFYCEQHADGDSLKQVIETLKFNASFLITLKVFQQQRAQQAQNITTVVAVLGIGNARSAPRTTQNSGSNGNCLLM